MTSFLFVLFYRSDPWVSGLRIRTYSFLPLTGELPMNPVLPRVISTTVLRPWPNLGSSSPSEKALRATTRQRALVSQGPPRWNLTSRTTTCTVWNMKPWKISVSQFSKSSFKRNLCIYFRIICQFIGYIRMYMSAIIRWVSLKNTCTCNTIWGWAKQKMD